MNKHQQSGMTTLLITSMLLIVALLFSLASYKNLFYQIKRTQNEVLARQAHWAAEGGLECGFAAIKNVGNISGARPTYIDDCGTSLKSVYLDVDDYINSEYKKISNDIIKKKINLSSRLAGAIQARSNLKLKGNYEIYPDVEGGGIDGNYKCVSVRYSNVFIFDKTEHGNASTTLKVLDPEKDGPYLGFNGKCANDYKSFLDTTTDSSDDATRNNLKKDFVYDPNFDPFESFFGDKRSELEKIRKEFVQISGSTENEGDNTCGKKIKNAFDSIRNKDKKVWVTGSCDVIDSNNLPLDLDPKMLVVENGLFIISGAAKFYGAIYHLYTDPINDMTNQWVGMSTYNWLNESDRKKAVYHQVGSFVPKGGLVLDSPGGLSIFTSGMVFIFKGDANPNKTSKVSWQQGSWHDF